MVEQKSKEEWLLYDKLKLHEILILTSMSEISLEPCHAVWFTYHPWPLSGREDRPESWAGVWPGEPAVRSVWPSAERAPAPGSVRPSSPVCALCSRAASHLAVFQCKQSRVRESDVCQGRRWRGEGTWVGFLLACEWIRYSEILRLERSINYVVYIQCLVTREGIYSWPLNNGGLNCACPFIGGFVVFFYKYIHTVSVFSLWFP